MEELNWLSISVAAVSAFILGGLWYSPVMFSRPAACGSESLFTVNSPSSVDPSVEPSVGFAEAKVHQKISVDRREPAFDVVGVHQATVSSGPVSRRGST